MTKSPRFNSSAKALALATALLLATGCGGGLQTQNALSSGNNGATGGTVQPTPDELWKSVQMDGVISGNGSYSGAPVISLDKVNKLLLLSLPMPFAIPTSTVKIPELGNGAQLKWGKMSDGSTPALVLSIPLDKVIKGLDKLDFPPVDTLPTGDRLADLGVAGGELPSFAVSLPIRGVKAYLYVGASTVAIFVNTPWSPPIGIGPIEIKDSKTGQTTGYFALLPGQTSKDGGVYVSAQMPDAIARIIDDIL